jgi:hypothetical protein
LLHIHFPHVHFSGSESADHCLIAAGVFHRSLSCEHVRNAGSATVSLILMPILRAYMKERGTLWHASDRAIISSAAAVSQVPCSSLWLSLMSTSEKMPQVSWTNPMLNVGT